MQMWKKFEGAIRIINWNAMSQIANECWVTSLTFSMFTSPGLFHLYKVPGLE